jgi:hypothetical protein
MYLTSVPLKSALLVPYHLPLTVVFQEFGSSPTASGLLESSSCRAQPTYPFLSLSIPLIWGVVLLLGLLVAAVVLFAVMARRKGRFLSIHQP